MSTEDSSGSEIEDGWRFVVRREALGRYLDEKLIEQKASGARAGLTDLVRAVQDSEVARDRSRAGLIAAASYWIFAHGPEAVLACPYDLDPPRALLTAAVSGPIAPAQVAPMFDALHPEPVIQDAHELYDLPVRASYEESRTALIELFVRLASLGNSALEPFRERRLGIFSGRNPSAFAASVYVERVCAEIRRADRRPADPATYLRSLPPGASADLAGDSAGRALALALVDAALIGAGVEVDHEQALAGVLDDLRLLSWSRVSGWR